MNELTPEIYFSNLPEIEALPFDLCISVFAVDESDNVLPIGPGIAPHHFAAIRSAMDKTSNLFGVSLQVWREERRLAG